MTDPSSGSTQLLVVGIFFQISETDRSAKLFTDVLNRVDQIASPGGSITVGALDFSEVVKHIRSYDLYQYGGSLTTPPCSEGVTWLVSKEPLPIAAATYNKAKRVMKFNSRYTQNNPGEQNLLEFAAGTLRP